MRRALSVLLSLWIGVGPVILAAASSGSTLAYLQKRLENDPTDATAHRLVGRLLLESGETTRAIEHLRSASDLDPLSAAARFDLGRALIETGDVSGAAAEWQQVLLLAPETEYAGEAGRLLSELPPDALAEVKTTSYEIREFPGPPAPEPIVDPLEIAEARLPIVLRLETGMLFNSNVALAPSSRQLAPGDRESFQGFVAPEIEWAAVRKDDFAVGPLFSGFFTLNEGNFREFNLQSYTPGIFAESTIHRDIVTFVPRLEYRYTLDHFEGREFATRHGVLGRLTALLASGGATTGYLAIDRTDFADDGILPEVTSADGTLYATGLAHRFQLDRRWIESVRAGVDLDRLDARGSDYAYWGIGLTGQAVIPIAPTVEATLRGGWGYRSYDRFEFEPDRNEFIWRAGGEVRKWFTPQLSAAGVANYQLFDSNNPLFEADRLTAGLVMEYLY